MDPEQWAKDRGIPINSLHRSHLREISEHDIKCTECRMGVEDTMLCSGLRMVFDEEASDFYGALRLRPWACEKLEAKNIEAERQGQLSRSGLSPSEIQRVIDQGIPFVTYEGKGEYFVNRKPIPTLSAGISGPKLARKLLALVVAFCNDRKSAKCIYTQWWYGNVSRWTELGFSDCLGVDFLYIERLDWKGGTDFAREHMFGTVLHRMAMGLPTVVTLSPTPTWRNESEEEIIKEIQGWNQIKL